ncbi:MAG: T9SS type A sorting domain-containing protein [Candidatus Kapaibacterium sp.]
MNSKFVGVSNEFCEADLPACGRSSALRGFLLRLFIVVALFGLHQLVPALSIAQERMVAGGGLGTLGSNPCLLLADTVLRFDTVLIGGESSLTTRITGLKVGKTLNVTAAATDTEFTMQPIFFNTVIKGDTTISLLVVMKPVSAGILSGVFQFSSFDSIACDTVTLTASGYGASPTANNSTFDLKQPASKFIGILSDSVFTSRTFSFRNNSSSAVAIDSIKLRKGGPFSLSQLPTLPHSVAPGDSIRIQIGFFTQVLDPQRDQLIVATDNPILTQAFSLEGMRKRFQNAVQIPRTANQFNIDVTPNPSRGRVTVSTSPLIKGLVEVFDLLGRSIARSPLSDRWVWNGLVDGGMIAPSGAYIIRVSGFDSHMREVVSSKRVIIQH